MAFNFQKWRKPLARGLAILAGLTALYSGVWFLIAAQLESGLANWTAQQRNRSWTVEHGKIVMTGFPLKWQIDIENPLLSRSSGKVPFHWSGPRIHLNMRPWNLTRIGFQTAGEHRLGYATSKKSESAKLKMGAGRGELLFDSEGRLNDLTFTVEGAVIETALAQTYRFTQLNARLDLSRPAAPDSKPHQIPAFHLTTELFGLTLPKEIKPVLGRTISRIALSADFLGGANGTNLKQALSHWARSGGSLNLKKLDIGWSKLDITGTGTLALDPTLQPIVAFSGRVSGYDDTLDAMADGGIIKPATAMVTRFALRALSNFTGDKKGARIRVSLTIQDGYLHVGPVKLVKLPKIIWN
ncbi:MAG: DUF2125 domain-containing protein [Alphaproteobacteria bacterium]|nr:DUF2125 domain-containing protein [Alphaproteobacteria bacterium]